MEEGGGKGYIGEMERKVVREILGRRSWEGKVVREIAGGVRVLDKGGGDRMSDGGGGGRGERAAEEVAEMGGHLHLVVWVFLCGLEAQWSENGASSI